MIGARVATAIRPVPAGRRSGASTWWLAPGVVVAAVVLLSVAMTFYVGPDVFIREYRTPKVITTDVLLLFLAGGMTLALGGAIAGLLRPPARPRSVWPMLSTAELDFLRRANTVLFRLSLVGYVGFAVAGVLRGITLDQLIATVTSDAIYELGVEEQLGTIPGVTTLTQVGMACTCVSALLLVSGGGRREIVRIGVLVGLATLRAFLLTERVAILELLLPVVVVLAARGATSRRGRRLVGLVPVVAVPLVAVVFAAFEFSRSWVFYRQFGGSFVSFALERLAGYYVTAYNNGYLEVTHGTPIGHWPSRVAEAFWQAPGIENIDLLGMLNGYDPRVRTAEILAQYGNPEFNNLSGIGIVFADLGPVGGLVYFLVAGLLAGLTYSAFCECRMWGLLLYPTIFISLLEIPRALNWSEGRTLPTFAAIAIIVVLHRRRFRNPQIRRDLT